MLIMGKNTKFKPQQVEQTTEQEQPVWEGYPSRDFKTPIPGFVIPGKVDTSNGSTQDTNIDVDGEQE